MLNILWLQLNNEIKYNCMESYGKILFELFSSFDHVIISMNYWLDKALWPNCLSKKLTTFDCIHHWAVYFKIVFYQSIIQIWTTVKTISCNVFISSKPTNQSSSMHQKYQCQTTSTWHQQHSSQIKVTTQFPDQSNNTVPRSK